MTTFRIPQLKQFAELLYALVTRGEVIQSGLIVKLPGVRRIVLQHKEHRVSIASPDGLTVARDRMGLIKQVNPEIERGMCPELWDLIVEDYVKLGPIGIRAKEPRPQLVIDQVEEYVRIRCENTVLELDYPGLFDPDIYEIRLWPDQLQIRKTGIDAIIVFD